MPGVPSWLLLFVDFWLLWELGDGLAVCIMCPRYGVLVGSAYPAMGGFALHLVSSLGGGEEMIWDGFFGSELGSGTIVSAMDGGVTLLPDGEAICCGSDKHNKVSSHSRQGIGNYFIPSERM